MDARGRGCCVDERAPSIVIAVDVLGDSFYEEFDQVSGAGRLGCASFDSFKQGMFYHHDTKVLKGSYKLLAVAASEYYITDA